MDTSVFFFFFFFFFFVFWTEFRKSLWKLFDKQDIIQILKRNNEKRQEKIMIMIYGLLPCWHMDEMRKWRFEFLWFKNAISLFYGMFIFIMGVSPSNFVIVSFFLTSLRKGYFLRQRIRRYRFLKWELQCCWFLIFYYQLLPEFQCEIDFCMMDGWIRFYQYNANVSLPKRHHWERQLHFESTFGRQWVHAIFSDYSKL